MQIERDYEREAYNGFGNNDILVGMDEVLHKTQAVIDCFTTNLRLPDYPDSRDRDRWQYALGLARQVLKQRGMETT